MQINPKKDSLKANYYERRTTNYELFRKFAVAKIITHFKNYNEYGKLQGFGSR
jgi:hypothetical protein